MQLKAKAGMRLAYIAVTITAMPSCQFGLGTWHAIA
jgi:hypothetical protein